MSLRIWLGVFALATTFYACSPESTPADQQLEALKKERAEIDRKILVLEKELGTATETSTAVPVAVYTTEREAFEHIIEVKGSVESRSSADVTPKISGHITALKVANGQSVTKGQVLLELDAEIVRKQMEEVQTQLDFATTLYEKQKRIYEKKAGSEIQYLQAKNNKESLERRMLSLNEQLAMSVVKAPVSGTVDNIGPRTGELVMPGMPLMTIVNTSDMRVVVDLAETYAATVQTGDAVKIVSSETETEITSKVGTVAKTVNPVSRTFRVEVPIRSGIPTLKPNQTCKVLISDQTIPTAIAIPLASIVREGAEEYVYVAEKGKAQKRKIETGLVSAGKVVVTSGLSANERVVVKGVQGIAAGQQLNIVQ